MAEERISLEDETPFQGYSDRMERISLEDTTLFVGYSNHIQRYAFAAQYCAGRRVLDAGCGSGYGSAYLIDRGSANVTAIDISDAALAEANRLFRRDKLRFVKGDLECLSEMGDLGGPFDVVVNLENIEHLAHPDRFLEGARRQLTGEGAMVISTPNGVLTARDEAGRILNRSHVQEFTEAEFRELLGPYFNRLELFGQWKTPERQVRIDFEHHLFENLCELYYSPGHRLWRALRKLLGKPCAAPGILRRRKELSVRFHDPADGARRLPLAARCHPGCLQAVSHGSASFPVRIPVHSSVVSMPSDADLPRGNPEIRCQFIILAWVSALDPRGAAWPRLKAFGSQVIGPLDSCYR